MGVLYKECAIAVVVNERDSPSNQILKLLLAQARPSPKARRRAATPALCQDPTSGRTLCMQHALQLTSPLSPS